MCALLCLILPSFVIAETSDADLIKTNWVSSFRAYSAAQDFNLRDKRFSFLEIDSVLYTFGAGYTAIRNKWYADFAFETTLNNSEISGVGIREAERQVSLVSGDIDRKDYSISIGHQPNKYLIGFVGYRYAKMAIDASMK